MCSKRLFMCFVVSVLVSVSVMAWPVEITKPTAGILTSSKETVTESTTESTETSTESTESSSETESSKWDNVRVLRGEDLQEFVAEYTDLKQNVRDLQNTNALLLKEKKSKFFADAGLAFGIRNKAVSYGFAADIGMRFGSSVMAKIGATYMFGSFADLTNISWNIDSLTVSATIGWEW